MPRPHFSLVDLFIGTALSAVLLAVVPVAPHESLATLAIGIALFSPIIVAVLVCDAFGGRGDS